MAIGYAAKVTRNDSVQLVVKQKQNEANTVAIGLQTKANGNQSIALGYGALTEAHGNNGVAMGVNAYIGLNGQLILNKAYQETAPLL